MGENDLASLPSFAKLIRQRRLSGKKFLKNKFVCGIRTMLKELRKGTEEKEEFVWKDVKNYLQGGQEAFTYL